MLAETQLSLYLLLHQAQVFALSSPAEEELSFPQTAVLDDFTREDASELGGNWTAFGQSGTGADGGIAGNQACNPDDGDGWNYFYYDTGTFGPDCEAYITAVTFDFNDGVQVLARLKDMTVDEFGSDGYMASMDKFGGGVELYRLDDFTPTLLAADATISPANGDSVGIRCLGGTISAWHKPAAGEWTKVAEAADSTYEDAGYIGWYLSVETSWRYDNFGGGNL